MNTVDKQFPRVRLARPATTGGIALAAALAQRRSCREFDYRPLSTHELGQLCWAAQGITHRDGLRVSPSAGALYPLTVRIADAQGVSEYLPLEHAIVRLKTDDIRRSLQQAAFDQECVGTAPACFAIIINSQQLMPRYHDRAERYCLLEAGHVAQNLLLQAVALGLAGVPVGAFRDRDVDGCLGAPHGFQTAYLVPIGRPATV